MQSPIRLTESSYAWSRLFASLFISTVGSAGMYLVVIILPEIQNDFGVSRGAASFSYTMVMLGFGLGGILFGRLVDLHGILKPLMISVLALATSFVVTGMVRTIYMLYLMHFMIGFFGCAVVFAPLVSDISKWFNKRRGFAVSICACGNFLAGAIWPPLFVMALSSVGWRLGYIYAGILSLLMMLPVSFFLRLPSPQNAGSESSKGSVGDADTFGMSSNQLTGVLCLAGLACCIAMAMPTVHIVALCSDRGFGIAVGAKMLSAMLFFGVISRLGFGYISDKLGGLRTILIGSGLQAIALIFYLFAETLPGLFAVSVIFGLFQGGIVPCYALIVREYFPSAEAGVRLGVVISATVLGMAVGGWISGAIYDWTGSYSMALVHGIAWNCVNFSVILFLLYKLSSFMRKQNLFSTS